MGEVARAPTSYPGLIPWAGGGGTGGGGRLVNSLTKHSVYLCNNLQISKEERDEKSSNLACADFKMNASTVSLTDYYKVKY